MSNLMTEFYAPFRANEDFMKIPRTFYKQWKHQLGDTFILEDDIGARFTVSLYVSNDQPFFTNGIIGIRHLYLIPEGCMVFFKYLGHNRFKFRISMTQEWPAAPSNRNTHVQILPNTNANPQLELEWTTKVTDALSKGKQALAVPAHVAAQLFEGKTTIRVKVNAEDTHTWSVLWTSTNQCRLGRGWYEYCKELKPRKNQIIRFTKAHGDDFISFHLCPS